DAHEMTPVATSSQWTSLYSGSGDDRFDPVTLPQFIGRVPAGGHDRIGCSQTYFLATFRLRGGCERMHQLHDRYVSVQRGLERTANQPVNQDRSVQPGDQLIELVDVLVGGVGPGAD